MVKPFTVSYAWYIIFSHPLAASSSPSWWTGQGLWNFVNQWRKISSKILIYFISFFYLLPTWSPQNWCDHAPLMSPKGGMSQVLVGCCVKLVICWPPKATIILFFLNSLLHYSLPQTMGNHPPNMFLCSLQSHLVILPLPITDTVFGWLLCVSSSFGGHLWPRNVFFHHIFCCLNCCQK